MVESELLPNDHSNHQSPYVGRWIATINGRVISQGGTPEQARQAAKASRFKETPNISYMSTKPPIFIHSILEKIARLVPNDLPVYVVGGAVRDALINIPVRDIDFALPERAII